MITTAMLVNLMLQAHELRCITLRGTKISIRTLYDSKIEGSRILANNKEGYTHILTVQEFIPHITQHILDREDFMDMEEGIRINTETNLPWAYRQLNSKDLKEFQELDRELTTRINKLKCILINHKDKQEYKDSLELIRIYAHKEKETLNSLYYDCN